MGLFSFITPPLLSLRTLAPALPIAIAVFIGQMSVWFLPGVWPAVFLVVGGVLLASLPRIGRCWLLGVVLGIATGIVRVVLHPAEWGSTDGQVLVRIEGRPTRRVPGEVTFVGREVLGKSARALRCRSVDLPWRHGSELEQGDVVWVRGSIVPLVRPLNPFSWDGWLWRQGVSGEMKTLFVSRPFKREESVVDALRRKIRDLVLTATDDSRGGALFLSMALGERDVLSSHVENAFKGVGMSHLLVVSGYQVSLIFGVVFGLCMQIRKVFGANIYLRNIATWCSFGCCFGYVVLVGAEMSSVRALVAAGCLCVALVIDRSHRFAQRWATALLLMQVIYPWALCEVGVVLTFAALAGIGMGGTLGGRRLLATYAWVNVSVWMMTSTVTLLWNGSISVWGVVLNLVLAAPWSIWNCAVGGAALLLAATSPTHGSSLLWLVAWLNEVVVQAILWTGGTAPSQRPLEGLARWAICGAMAIGCALIAWRATRQSYAASIQLMVKRQYRRS